MAQLSCTFFSEVLGTETNLCIVLPDPKNFPGVSSPKFQTLTLLHGFSDNQSDWLRKSSAERYACDRCLALVLPFADKSFYTDMAYGDRWWTYISEELPAVARAYFPLSARREDNFVAGNSMGGYGAFKAAMTYPQRYAAFGSFSGALDIEAVAAAAKGQGLERQAQDVFGGKPIAGSENDLFALTGRAMASGNKLPRAYLSCGDADEACYSMNLKMRSFLLERSYPLTWCKVPGGRHDWDVWEAQIQRFLDWLDQ